MTDTFKSGQWRVCAGCIASIAPKDRVCVLYDEIHCMTCLTADEEDSFRDLTNDGVNEALSGEAQGAYITRGDDE